MPLYDLPLDQLREYRPQSEAPGDLLQFWQKTITETRQTTMAPLFTEIDCGLTAVRTYDVTFPGFRGQAIKAWFVVPRDIAPGKQLPCVVEYIGYGGGRGLPHQWLLWPCAGYAFLVMDTRGQGSTWQNGDTPDIEEVGSNPQYPGYMTRGILDPQHYYYRRVYADAVRAVETALTRAEVDPHRVFLTGGSQGGGIALAAAALIAGIAPIKTGNGSLKLAGVMADVPFLCHMRRATEITAAFPYQEIVQFLKNQRTWLEPSFQTLAYFDNLNLAPFAAAPALFSVALMDEICPPSTVFAAFNAYATNQKIPIRKEIRVYPYNGHEQGQEFQAKEKLAFARGIASQ